MRLRNGIFQDYDWIYCNDFVTCAIRKAEILSDGKPKRP